MSDNTPNFIAKDDGDIIIVRMSGDLNAKTMPKARKMIDKLIKLHDIYKRNNLRILIDYEYVTDVDTATLANILQRMNEHKEHYHTIALVNIPDDLKSMIEIHKLQDVFNIYDSEQKALADLRKLTQ